MRGKGEIVDGGIGVTEKGGVVMDRGEAVCEGFAEMSVDLWIELRKKFEGRGTRRGGSEEWASGGW